MSTKTILRASILTLLAAGAGAHAADAITFDAKSIEVPAGSLASALEAVAKQFGVNVIYTSHELRNVTTPGIKGNLTAHEAIEKLLEGTQLTIKVDPSGSVMVAPTVPQTSAANVSFDSRTSSAANVPVRMAQADLTHAGVSETGAVGGDEAANVAEQSEPAKVPLEEIVVTGSHIRGVENLSSPVIRFSREDIEKSGYSTTQQFVQNLTQNFSDISDNNPTASTAGVKGTGKVLASIFVGSVATRHWYCSTASDWRRQVREITSISRSSL